MEEGKKSRDVVENTIDLNSAPLPNPESIRARGSELVEHANAIDLSSSSHKVMSDIEDDRISIASSSKLYTDGTTSREDQTRLLPSHPISRSTSSSRTSSPSRPPPFLDEIAKSRTPSTTASSPRTTSILSRPIPTTPIQSSLSNSLPIPSLTSTPITAVTSSSNTPRVMNRPTTQIGSLLRRNYTYFASLLQEPEGKWRSISDHNGVAVSQMISIDPTVTIFRAEKTLVNVGVWDVFSTIGNPGARAHWDKNFESATLLDELDSASLWHLKTKGTWPVAPRDCTIVQMAYQSPSSVHVLSFSTDDTNLFPSLQPPILPTIRAQVDLHGWVVEALSPTTTRITLLNQSDDKGWASKSWTPTDMVNQLAGVGEFTIKYGGPPILVALVGAKKTISSYEHGKRLFKTEYKALTIPPIPSPTPDPKENIIESQLRCDCTLWCSSLVILIEPPPLRVSCVTRHRLSESGGTWITIEHDKKLVGEKSIMVSVRKGGDNREKGSISVNGSDIQVIIEKLEDDQIEQLTKRKRVKNVPVPLDQATWTPGSPSAPSPIAPKFSRNHSTKLISPPSPLLQEMEPKSILKSPPLEPPAHALQALSWLQTFHAGQSTELTDPAPGWTTVTERSGVIVRKKIVTGISDLLPVYRGDKIVQGLSADEISSIISSYGCRSQWDERIESAIPLATYGNGISTAAFTTKAIFPFSGRSFHVASANANVRIPSASASSTSTILFCASASYAAGSRFDLSKTNPNKLLPGDVILEGWILETLDPYASSMLAIPSTRVSYLSCVDNSSYVPLAFNSILNANLSRIINSVENLGKNAGPLPRLQNPDSVLQVEGPLSDDGDQAYIWNLSQTESSSIALSSDFSIQDSTFRSLYRISTKKTRKPKLSGLSLSRPPSAISSTLLKSELPRSASLTFSPPISAPSLQKPSTSEITKKSSLNSLKPIPARSNSPPAPTKSIAEDLIVAELIVDLKQYPNGFSIVASSSLILSEGETISLDPVKSVAPRQVPLLATVHDAPLPAIVSASLNSWKRHNYLVRVLVPTSTLSESIRDPSKDFRPSLPDWYKSLGEFGAVVDVRIIPLPKVGEENEVKVTFNGEDLKVQSLKESRAVLARFEEEDWNTRGAKISRIPRKVGLESDSILPISLREPIALATRLLAYPTHFSEELEVFPDPKSPGSSTPAETGARSPVISSRPLANNPDKPESPTVPLLGILGSYPLPHIASNFTMTFPITDDPSTSSRRTYTLSFVLIICVISFLLGSFLRSLCSPADFLLRSYDSNVGGNDQIEAALMQAFDLNWRSAIRLLEFKLGWFKWDLLVAFVESES